MLVLASFLVGTFICGIAYLIEKILIWDLFLNEIPDGNKKDIVCDVQGRSIKMTAGEKIRKRRLELGITQKDVARMIGTTSTYVSAVEKQKRGVKKETRLAKFAEALQCSVNDLKPDAPKKHGRLNQ